jgi:hypothetical protein
MEEHHQVVQGVEVMEWVLPLHNQVQPILVVAEAAVEVLAAQDL